MLETEIIVKGIIYKLIYERKTIFIFRKGQCIDILETTEDVTIKKVEEIARNYLNEKELLKREIQVKQRIKRKEELKCMIEKTH